MNKVSDEFSKSELMSIADELELKFKKIPTTVRLGKLILADLDDNGIPDEDECSDLMYSYLAWVGFIEDEDDGGDTADKVDEDVVVEDDPQEESIDLPDCYSCADDRDPACNKCKIYDACIAERMKVRDTLSCYGNLYNMNAEECKLCLESGSCRSNVRSKMKRR